MNYVGVDIHKRYSVLVVVDERGQELKRGRINGNEAAGFAQFFSSLQGKTKWCWKRAGTGAAAQTGVRAYYRHLAPLLLSGLLWFHLLHRRTSWRPFNKVRR